MPFDTTYYLSNSSRSVDGQVVIHGGIDTSIYLGPGQLPSDVDTLLSANDSAVSQAYQLIFNSSATKDAANPKPYTPDSGLLLIFIAVFGFIFYKIWQQSKSGSTYSETIFTDTDEPKPRSYLTYYGDELNFTDEQLATILTQRFPYYNILTQPQKMIFLERLQKFMTDKTFKIHGEKGYKEMPVLISAAAIQLTFGLKKYLLPHFEFIHVHPQEFLRVRPILCFLEGNVSGHSINLSWKHFLEGYANPNDGQNVGLHELAHALHYQAFVVEKNVDKSFRNYYTGFIIDGNKAYDSEKSKTVNLYSEYAEKNLQEFWAESVEIFFEKPAEMQSLYPKLYESMKHILNQDPVNGIPSSDS
jgi:Mlc titration factor MtfA (ptsG expression regulator)